MEPPLPPLDQARHLELGHAIQVLVEAVKERQLREREPDPKPIDARGLVQGADLLPAHDHGHGVAAGLGLAHLLGQDDDLRVELLHARSGVGHAQVEGELRDTDGGHGEHDGGPPRRVAPHVDVLKQVLDACCGAPAVVEAQRLQVADVLRGSEVGRQRLGGRDVVRERGGVRGDCSGLFCAGDGGGRGEGVGGRGEGSRGGGERGAEAEGGDAGAPARSGSELRPVGYSHGGKLSRAMRLQHETTS